MKDDPDPNDSTEPTFLEAWGETLREAFLIRREHYGLRYARTLSTERLKQLWDEYDGADDDMSDPALSGEAVHQVLNERGEGEYCAV